MGRDARPVSPTRPAFGRPPSPKGREGALAAIHIGKKALGLADPEYRALLLRVTGLASSAGMTAAQHQAVLAEMGRLGFQQQKFNAPAHVRKCFALWKKCHTAGSISDGSAKALSAFVKRQTGIERVEWLTPEDAPKVIEALKPMSRRVKGPSP